MSQRFSSSKLQKLLAKSDLTQVAIAYASNIHPSNLSAYARGAKTPNTSTIQKLTEFFNVSSDYFSENSTPRVTEKVSEETVSPVIREESATQSVPFPPETPFVSMFVVVDKFTDGDFLVKMEGKFYRANLTEL